MVDGIATEILCSICDEVCKRGAKLKCCAIRACRACATVKLSKSKKCWNDNCDKDVVQPETDLINDVLLRKAVDYFNKNGKLDPEHKKQLAKGKAGSWAVAKKKAEASNKMEEFKAKRKAERIAYVDISEKFLQPCRFGAKCKIKDGLCLFDHSEKSETEAFEKFKEIRKERREAKKEMAKAEGKKKAPKKTAKKTKKAEKDEETEKPKKTGKQGKKTVKPEKTEKQGKKAKAKPVPEDLRKKISTHPKGFKKINKPWQGNMRGMMRGNMRGMMRGNMGGMRMNPMMGGPGGPGGPRGNMFGMSPMSSITQMQRMKDELDMMMSSMMGGGAMGRAPFGRRGGYGGF